MNVVVDTSILIDHLRGGTKWDFFLKTTSSESEVFIPTIVIFELFGGQSSKRVSVRESIEKIVIKLEILDLNSKIAKKAGELYREIGKHIGTQDYVIAASALEINGAVLTLNTKHFEKIPNLQIYSLES